MSHHQAQLGQRLAHKTGLASDLLERATVTGFVHQRCRQLGLRDERDYLKLLEHCQEELERLVQEVAVAETWFFRYPNSYQLLVNHLRQLFQQTIDPTPLRMLSVACATGEEPYSMAMAAVSAGWPPARIAVDAVDRHEASLVVARRATYRPRALRESPPVWSKPWLVFSDDSLQVDARLVAVVNFICGDVLSESFSTPARLYDIVFCRNLLIYLNATARERLADRLAMWVRPDGLLFVGHAEHSGMLRTPFASVASRHAFALRAASSAAAPTQRNEVARAKPSDASEPVKLRHRWALPQPSRGSSRTSEPTADGAELPSRTAPINTRSLQASEECTLDHARAQADCGDLEQALSTLQTLLRRDQPDPMAYELLGNVQLGRQRLDEARVAFEKVLYLLPDRAESLLHLAMICDRQGDARRAARYRQRAARSHRQQRSNDDAT